MTRSRRLTFAAVVLLVVAGALEAAATWAEPQWFPYERTQPVPAPSTVHEARITQATQANVRRSVETGAIPLASDPDRGWALSPDTVTPIAGWSIRTNSLGLRGPELTPKPEGTVRLFTLGDSSVFGDGVDESRVFSAVAARELADRWGRPVDTVIGAIPGHGVTQSLQSVQLLGARVAPDWVIVGNLWSDIYVGATPVSDPAYLPASKVLRRSATYRVLWHALSPWLEARKVRWMAGRDDVGSLTDPDSPTRTPLPTYVATLHQLADEAERLGARPLFLVLPAPIDFDVVPPPDAVTAFREALRAVAEAHGAPCVDGPALFRRLGANTGYFEDQVHPNDLGHALLGHAVAEAIADASR